MVVIPTLLTHPAEVDSLLKQLEMHYLRNPDPHLSFALLTDFADTATAKTAFGPETSRAAADTLLLGQTQTSIEALNQRYAGQPFYFFHRHRQWNPRENTWMGWERKRGKLHEFNQLLRGHSETSYTIQVGNLDILPQIQYIITLDADTILPREGANRLIGTLAHPLNRAQFDPRSGKVTAGYTILQPRTEIQSTSANRSFFTRIFAGDSGLDLYTLAVSDVHQDLFGEGSYVGKGIYHIDAFERSLAGRIPENTLLSHDLFEGIYGRAGLVTDIVLYEQYPAHYFTSVRRAQRWVRGDWQLLPWLMPWTPKVSSPSRSGKRFVRNDLSVIGRWKIADNLRRSLLSPMLILLFVAGWLWLPGSPLVWTLLGVLTPAVPPPDHDCRRCFAGIWRGVMGRSDTAVTRHHHSLAAVFSFFTLRKPADRRRDWRYPLAIARLPAQFAAMDHRRRHRAPVWQGGRANGRFSPIVPFYPVSLHLSRAGLLGQSNGAAHRPAAAVRLGHRPANCPMDQPAKRPFHPSSPARPTPGTAHPGPPHLALL